MCDTTKRSNFLITGIDEGEKKLRRPKLPQTTKDITKYIQATHKTPLDKVRK